MVILNVLYHLLIPAGGIYYQIDYGHAAIDLLMLLLFGYLSIRANRIYPLWMFAAQIISTLMHIDRQLSSSMEPVAYMVLTRLPSYIQIIVLALGLIAHRRRIRRFGTYRSWRNS